MKLTDKKRSQTHNPTGAYRSMPRVENGTDCSEATEDMKEQSAPDRPS